MRTTREDLGILRGEFRDIDHFNETVRGWNLQFKQIDRGELDAELIQLHTRHANITSTRISRIVDQSGAPPPGMRTFGIKQDSLPWMQWCGRDIEEDPVLCFRPDSDYDCLSPVGFAVFSLSFDTEWLEKIAARLGHPELLDRLDVHKAVDGIDAVRLDELRALLRTGFSSGFLADTTESLAEELVMLLTDTGSEDVRETLATRSRAVRNAVSHILEHAHEPVSVGEVCESSNVSWRTLDRAFREFLTITPKACIGAVRLHGARRDLIQADPSASVADIANKWGFWHLGSFAKDYRLAFNELPSQTLSEHPRTGNT